MIRRKLPQPRFLEFAEDAAGLTVAKVLEDGGCYFIRFTDGTCLCPRSDAGYVFTYQPNLPAELMLELGCIDQDQYDSAERFEESLEARERAEYERLKAKFEGKP